MRTLMSGAARVAYSQIYVDSGDAQLESLEVSFGGQVNGLCGAGTPGFLYLITGLNTGEVSFTVELHDEPPPLDDGWQEIVEASFASGGWANLVSWANEASWALDLAADTTYRVRYCATGMDEGHRADTRSQADPAVELFSEVRQEFPVLAAAS